MTANECRTPGCDAQARCVYCWRCNRRRRADNRALLRSLVVRLQEKIQMSKERFEGVPCWLWTGALSSSGYGSVWDRGSSRQAHLVVYELLVRGGKRLRGKRRELDHRCRNRRCVNPAHLEPVTRGENNRRSTCWHHLHGERTGPEAGIGGAA